MRAAGTLSLVVVGLFILSWLSSSPRSTGAGLSAARALRVLGHFLVWSLIIGGFSCGALLI